MIGRNVIVNVLGGSWSALLALLIVPFQIKLLGVEAYGLLAFLASLQIVFTVFDFGLSPAITREVAGDVSPGSGHSRDLVQSLSTAYWGIGIVLGLVLAASAGWLVDHWLKLDALSAGSATLAIQLSAVMVTLRWPVSFYAGIIAGRQRFDLLNLLTSGATTLGLLGGLLVITISSSLTAFLAWRIVAAVVEVTLNFIVCRRLLPGLTLWPRFPAHAIKQLWQFAVSMNLITIVSLVLTQGDKFLISKLLPIEALGYYSLAFNLAFSLALVQGMISSVLFPAFAAAYGHGETDVLADRCNKATQVISYCVALPAFLLIFFGYDLLRLWVGLTTAQASGSVLAVLAFAFLLAGPLNVCSTLATATGHPRIPLLVNVAGLFFYIPCLYLLTMQFSLFGAALTWLFLELYYVATLAPLSLRLLDKTSTVSWFGRNVLPFVLIGALTFGGAKIAASLAGESIIAAGIACGLAGIAYAAAGFLVLHRDLKAHGRRYRARLCLAFMRVLRLRGVVGVG